MFPARRKVISVHGCYWHLHHCRYGRVAPATNRAFWQAKREGNVVRDRRVRKQLRRDGWDVMVVWECQIKHKPAWLLDRMVAFLES